MLLKECYETFDGDYEGVMGRISKGELIERLVIKFLSDPSFDNLCLSLKEGDYKEAFRAAHSLKGVCANLGFSKLCESSSLLTECLRGKEKEQIDIKLCSELFEQVEKDYKAVTDAIRQLG